MHLVDSIQLALWIHLQCAFMYSNVINSVAVHGQLAKKKKLDPIGGNWVINSICAASYCGCSSSLPSHMMYVFGPEPLRHTPPLSHTPPL